MANLSKYLAKNGETLRAFAARTKISPSFLSELMNEDEARRKSPSIETAKTIQKATNGEVALSDWPKWAEIGRAFHTDKRLDVSPQFQGQEAEKVNEGRENQIGGAS